MNSTGDGDNGISIMNIVMPISNLIWAWVAEKFGKNIIDASHDAIMWSGDRCVERGMVVTPESVASSFRLSEDGLARMLGLIASGIPIDTCFVLGVLLPKCKGVLVAEKLGELPGVRIVLGVDCPCAELWEGYGGEEGDDFCILKPEHSDTPDIAEPIVYGHGYGSESGSGSGSGNRVGVVSEAEFRRMQPVVKTIN